MVTIRNRGTKLFNFQVEARLKQPKRSADGLQSVSHFVRSYYIRGRDEQDALTILAQDIMKDGADLLSVNRSQECPESDIPLDLKDLLQRSGRGVWWRSGRVFYQVE